MRFPAFLDDCRTVIVIDYRTLFLFDLSTLFNILGPAA
jgi:hypothetical protein